MIEKIIVVVASLVLASLTGMAQESKTDADRYLEARLEAQEKWMREALVALEKRSDVALASADKAVSKAEEAVNRRLEGMNEFRSQMKDQQALYITRTEAWAYFIGLAGILMWVQRSKSSPIK